jgi:DNA-binding LacI/PurR family transcriptional regulator
MDAVLWSGGRSLCDAIVLMDIQTNDARISVAASLNVPVILIGVPENTAGLYCVDLDFPLAARMAIGELAMSGHDRVVMISYTAEVIAGDINYVGRFLRAARESAALHGIQYDVVAPAESGRAALDAAVEKALGAGGDHLGLVVQHPETVQWVLHALTTRGVVPGRDISVVGLCTDAQAEESAPPVTNVSLQPREVSRRAMQVLFNLIDRERENPFATVDLVTPG